MFYGFLIFCMILHASHEATLKKKLLKVDSSSSESIESLHGSSTVSSKSLKSLINNEGIKTLKKNGHAGIKKNGHVNIVGQKDLIHSISASTPFSASSEQTSISLFGNDQNLVADTILFQSSASTVQDHFVTGVWLEPSASSTLLPNLDKGKSQLTMLNKKTPLLTANGRAPLIKEKKGLDVNMGVHQASSFVTPIATI